MTKNNKPDMYYFCTDYPFSDDQVTIGAIAMTAKSVESVTETLKKIKGRTPLSWDQLSTSNTQKARDFLYEFCRLMNENKAHFHLRFTSIQQVDIIHKMELSDNVKISHLYYHLILQRAFRFYAEKYELHIRPTNENVKPIFEKMRVKMHKDSFDLYGSKHDPITSLETSPETENNINLMLNLAVSTITVLRHKAQNAEKVNDHHRTLISFMEKELKIPNLYSNSGAVEQRFSIWNDEPSLVHTGFRGLF